MKGRLCRPLFVMKMYHFFVVGTGGTGGNLAELLCRYLAGEERNRFTLTFIDGDTVEAKNLKRQPFYIEDIGRNKAEALADSLGNGHDINIQYYDQYLDSAEELQGLIDGAEELYKSVELVKQDKPDEEVTVLLGCVDNDACRKILHEVFYAAKGNMVYIDSGNEFDYGQVCFGIKNRGKIVSPPLAYYHAEVMNGTHTPRSEESCEALNNSAPQHLVTNMLAADIVMTAISKIYDEGKCPTGVAYFNSMEFAVRHQPFVPEDLLKEVDLSQAGGAFNGF